MPKAEVPPSRETRPTADGSSERRGLIGQLVAGRYRVVEMLGSGAMGEVYLGEHVTIGRHDAIKVLSRRYVDDPELRTRFLRGARNLARIRHPNVCAVYDFGETEEGAQFLAIEYVAGGTLGELVGRTGPLPVQRALRIAIQVARGLQAAHDAGIVHRDLKPENVMLAVDRDGRDQPKVVDFDIAKDRTEDTGGDVTRLGAIVGTPRYMSPEQLFGDPLDGRSDLYSLGLVTFWMLTGRQPFNGETTRETTIRRLENRALTLEEVSPGRFPARLGEELERALRRDVEGRHESAAAFADALQALLPSDDWNDAGRDPDEGTHIADPPTAVLESAAAFDDRGRAGDTILAPTGSEPPGPVPGGRRTPSRRLLVALAGGSMVALTVAVGGPWARRASLPVDLRGPAVSAEYGQLDEAPVAGVQLADDRPPGDPADPPAARSSSSPGATPRYTTVEADPTGASGTDDDRRRMLAALRQFAVVLSSPESSAAEAATVGDSVRVLWRSSALDTEARHWAAYVIGLSELKLARQDSALAWVERAVALDPDNRGYRALQTALKGRQP